jgi:hypothetical protein
MKNFICAVAIVAFGSFAFAGEKAPTPVKAEAKACDCQVVEVARRPLLGGRRAAACCETVMVPATKTVTVYETKKVLVEKEVKVPVKKEVATLVPAKVVAAPACACAPAAVAPVRRLGGRLRGVTASAVDCVACK